MKSQSIVTFIVADNRSLTQSGNESQMPFIKGEESPGALTKTSGKSNKLNNNEPDRCISGFSDLFANLCPPKTFEVAEAKGTQIPEKFFSEHERIVPPNERNPEPMQAQAFHPATDLRQFLNSTSLLEAQAEPWSSGIAEAKGEFSTVGKDIVDPMALQTGNGLSVTQTPRTFIEDKMVLQRPDSIESFEFKDDAKGQPVQMTNVEKELPVSLGPETPKEPGQLAALLKMNTRTEFKDDEKGQPVQVANVEKELPVSLDRETPKDLGQLPALLKMNTGNNSTKGPMASDPAEPGTALDKTAVYPTGESLQTVNTVQADGPKSLKPKEFDQKFSTRGQSAPLLARRLEEVGKSHAESVEFLETNAPERHVTDFPKDNSKLKGRENLQGVDPKSETPFYPKNHFSDTKAAHFDEPGFFEYKTQSSDMSIEDPASPSKGDFAFVDLDNEKPINTIKQIVQKMTMYASAGQNRMRIQLKPEMFGGLKIEILSENQQVAIRMTAESTAVKEIIEQNLHLLKNELSQHGLEIIKFDVLIQNNADNLNNSQQFTPFSTPQRQNQSKERAHMTDLEEDGDINEFTKDAKDGQSEIVKSHGIDFFA